MAEMGPINGKPNGPMGPGQGTPPPHPEGTQGLQLFCYQCTVYVKDGVARLSKDSKLFINKKM